VSGGFSKIRSRNGANWVSVGLAPTGPTTNSYLNAPKFLLSVRLARAEAATPQLPFTRNPHIKYPQRDMPFVISKLKNEVLSRSSSDSASRPKLEKSLLPPGQAGRRAPQRPFRSGSRQLCVPLGRAQRKRHADHHRWLLSAAKSLASHAARLRGDRRIFTMPRDATGVSVSFTESSPFQGVCSKRPTDLRRSVGRSGGRI
jgi:hypothetical protein